MDFVLQVEPKNLEEALLESNWIATMQEELNKFEYNEVWFLVPRTSEMNIIGTKWVYNNKMDEHGAITRNKARLLAKGCNQEEGIDFDETYAPVARLEVVSLLLEFSNIKGFRLFQMDVKSAFLNEYLQETKVVGLWYPNNVSLNLTGFSYSDFAGCKIDRKSISGTCHMFGSSLIS